MLGATIFTLPQKSIERHDQRKKERGKKIYIGHVNCSISTDNSIRTREQALFLFGLGYYANLVHSVKIMYTVPLVVTTLFSVASKSPCPPKNLTIRTFFSTLHPLTLLFPPVPCSRTRVAETLLCKCTRWNGLDLAMIVRRQPPRAPADAVYTVNEVVKHRSPLQGNRTPVIRTCVVYGRL